MPSESANGHTAAPAPFGLRHDAWGRLVLIDAAGHEHVGAAPIRAFPISDPSHGIAVCDTDGRELVWVERLEDLPPAVRHVLEADLARREFVPVVRRILRVSAPVEPSEWEVETDRGRTTFVLPGEDNVYRLDDRRALLIDAHGIRYLIADTHALDATSRRLLERYL
jgi:hypothetical protein